MRPPQFSLRTLLVAMTACSGLLAAMSAVGPVWSLGMLLVLLMVGAHVIGNALGTKLRDQASQANEEPPVHALRKGAASHSTLRHSPNPGMTGRRQMPQRTWVIALGGALTGGAVGGLLLTLFVTQPLTPGAATLGVFSMAVLGGFAGFLASSFCSVFRQSFREAREAQSSHLAPRDEPTPK